MFELNGKNYEVPEWIIAKNLDSGEAYAWSVGDGERLERETEKAVLVAKSTDFGRVSVWCPKSVLVTEEQAKAEAAKAASAFENGRRYNEYLRDVAAANGVKIGNLRRTDAISAKLAEKNVEYMSKAEFLAA